MLTLGLAVPHRSPFHWQNPVDRPTTCPLRSITSAPLLRAAPHHALSPAPRPPRTAQLGTALAVIAVSALVFQFARLATIWQRHLLEKNKAPEAASLIELFAYLVLSHSALAAVVFLSTQPNALGLNDLNLSHTDRVAADLSQVLLVVGLFVLSFLPLFFAFFLQARQSVRLRNQRLLRDDVVSRMSLFIMLTLFGGIGLLAWAAAGRMFEMTSDFGVLVTGVVVIAFVATILAPHVARYWNDQSEKISARRFVKNSSFPWISG